MWITRERASMADGGAGRRVGRRRGFTLVELLVVIAIIALLVAILVPSLTGARTQAKAVATQSKIAGLSGALDQYKAEAGLGGLYPPSKSDDDPMAGVPSDRIADPLPNPGGAPSGADLLHTTGANLLVYALYGADGLGTPGFPDLDNDGKWWNDFGMENADPHGAYGIDQTTAEPLVPRYGPFVGSDAVIKSIRSIGELVESGVFRPPNTAWNANFDQGDYKHKVFADEFNRPILYYRARRGARAMIPTGNLPGIYDPYDNVAITGRTAQGGALESGFYCLYPTDAGVQSGKGHPLGYFTSQLEPTEPVSSLDPASPSFQALYDGSFEQYIWDRTVTARPTPVNKNSFLLISAGADGLYGTADDLTNFKRN